MPTKRDRAQMANHYSILFGDGPAMPVPPKRTRRPSDPEQPSEHQIQCAVVNWWRLSHRLYGLPEYSLYAVPNAGYRNAIAGARLKAEGMRRGIPDLFLAAPRNKLAGLFLELKRHGNTTTPEQREVIAYLNREGYATAVCWSAAEAQDKIVQYLRRVI